MPRLQKDGIRGSKSVRNGEFRKSEMEFEHDGWFEGCTHGHIPLIGR
jgi:hypothetical protein